VFIDLIIHNDITNTSYMTSGNLNAKIISNIQLSLFPIVKHRTITLNNEPQKVIVYHNIIYDSLLINSLVRQLTNCAFN